MASEPMMWLSGVVALASAAIGAWVMILYLQSYREVRSPMTLGLVTAGALLVVLGVLFFLLAIAMVPIGIPGDLMGDTPSLLIVLLALVNMALVVSMARAAAQ